jgi:tetratricopeptide (TPR) repeat protein
MSSARDIELIEQARRQAARMRAVGGSSAHDQAGASPVALPAATRISADSIPGGSNWLPNYEMIREIHRGAQGVVYLALQRSTGRQVAIKVLREGPFAGRADHIRFQQEVEVLAGIHHPNIVTIHDSGSAGGFFYYVMEYVEGLPLDEFAAAHSPTTPEKLTLIAKICDGVHAAHLRGVIHRDLKPGNIRVDTLGEPHILDFGLAKLAVPTDQEPALTQTGQFVGSLPWSSPEQVDGRHESVDIRTDIYSLGVIAHQLLTAHMPYELTGSTRQIMERITQSPPRPLREFFHDIDADLDTIVLKCLDKDPQRRYQSAADLAVDIRHHLSGEPIAARRDSMLYVLRKNARRYRLALAIAAAFVLLITASTVALSVMYKKQRELAIRAEQQAQAALREQQRAESFARDAKEKFRLASDTAAFMLEQVTGKLMQILGTGPLRKEILSKTYERFDVLAGEQADDPDLKAKLAKTHVFLGIIATDLAQIDDAVRHQTAAKQMFEELLTTDPRNPVLLTGLSGCLSSSGRLAERRGNSAAAEKAYNADFEVCQRLLEVTPDDPAAIRRFANCCSRKADLAFTRSQFDEYKKWNEKNHELRGKIALARPENLAYQHEYAMSFGRLGEIERLAGHYPEAKAHFLRALEIDDKLIAAEPNNGMYLINLNYCCERMAAIAEQSGDPAEHRTWARKKYDLARIAMNAEPGNPLHRLTYASSCDRLGLLSREAHDLPTARALHTEALALHRGLVASEPDNLDYPGPFGTCLTQLGIIAFEESRTEDAAKLLTEAVHVLESLDTKKKLSFQAILSCSDAHNHLGKIALTAGDIPAQIEHYKSRAKLCERAITLNPHPADSPWSQAAAESYEILQKIADQQGDTQAAHDYQSLRNKLAPTPSQN